MTARPALGVAAALALSAALPAHAARLPEPGGSVRVLVDGTAQEALLHAHVRLPLLEPLDAREEPGLDGAPGFRSDLLTSIRPEAGGARLRLTPAGGGLPDWAVRRCLGPDAWAGRALKAAALEPAVRPDEGSLVVEFPRPLGSFAEFLAGCLLPAPDDARALFVVRGGGDTLSLAEDPGPRAPLLDSLQFVLPGLVAPSYEADVELFGPTAREGDFIGAPSPDVLLLLPDADARERLPLLSGDRAAALRRDLGPDLLAAVFWGGRGAAAEGILPPGVGPARPLPRGTEAPAQPLVLRELTADAPTLAVTADGTDPPSRGLAERLAVVLRSAGWRTTPDTTDGAPSLRILRWRPPSGDPATSLLALAGEADLPVPAALRDALVAASPEERTQAAALLERAWLREGRAIPIMTAESGVVVSPDLRGVTVGRDGLPRLLDAWWAGGAR